MIGSKNSYSSKIYTNFNHSSSLIFFAMERIDRTEERAALKIFVFLKDSSLTHLLKNCVATFYQKGKWDPHGRMNCLSIFDIHLKLASLKSKYLLDINIVVKIQRANKARLISFKSRISFFRTYWEFLRQDLCKTLSAEEKYLPGSKAVSLKILGTRDEIRDFFIEMYCEYRKHVYHYKYSVWKHKKIKLLELKSNFNLHKEARRIRERMHSLE